MSTYCCAGNVLALTGPSCLHARFLIFMAIGISVSSFLLRLQFPMDSDQVMNLHVFQWPQFIAMFSFGAVCADGVGCEKSREPFDAPAAG